MNEAGSGSELEALRRRVTSLEQENADLRERLGPSAPPAGSSRARRPHNFWANVCFAVATILVPVSILAMFVKAEVTDSGRYVDTVAPLATEPPIQSYVADRVTTRLFEEVDVEQYVREALPDRAQRLTGPIANGFESFTREATTRILESEQFERLWVEANELAHEQMVKLLTDQGENVEVSRGGEVKVDLSGVAEQVQQRLSERGVDLFEQIPTERLSAEVTVFRSEGLYRARRVVGALETAAFVLPVLTIALFGLAIWLSESRRRGFVKAAVGLTLGVGILAAVLAIGRTLYLDAAVDGGIPEEAAAAVWDTILRYLHTSIRNALLIGIVVVLAVFLAGPSRPAVGFRRTVRRGVDRLGAETDRAGWRVLGANELVRRYRAALRIGVGVATVAILVWWSYPTPRVIVVAALVALLALAVVEFFGRTPKNEVTIATRPPASAA